jgi:glutathione peroxidase
MSIYDFTVTALDGTAIPLERYRGQALLIVNVASQCGFTPQYAGLEALHREYHDRGFSVLGFPCNQFGEQEPGTAAEIAAFCDRTYQVSFPLFARVDVNGDHTSPLWNFLKEQQPGVLGTTAIKWNFTKFLVSPTGEVLRRYAPKATPEEIEPDIAALMAGS